MKFAFVMLGLCLGGCTLADRNAIAVGLCERTNGCTVTKNATDYGPPQGSAMENRKPVSKTTKR